MRRRKLLLGLLSAVTLASSTRAVAYMVGSMGAWGGRPLPSFTPGYQPNFSCFTEYNGGVQWRYNPTLSAGCGSNVAQWEISLRMPASPPNVMTAHFGGMQSNANEMMCQLESADNWGDHVTSGWAPTGPYANWDLTLGVGVAAGNALYGVCTLNGPLTSSGEIAILNFVQL